MCDSAIRLMTELLPRPSVRAWCKQPAPCLPDFYPCHHFEATTTPVEMICHGRDTAQHVHDETAQRIEGVFLFARQILIHFQHRLESFNRLPPSRSDATTVEVEESSHTMGRAARDSQIIGRGMRDAMPSGAISARRLGTSSPTTTAK